MSETSNRAGFAAALTEGGPAADLDDAVADAFPNLEAFREGDDLVILAGDTRRLLVRRVGPDRFRVSDHAAASGSTNLLDTGTERDLDGLIEDIAAFASH